RRAPGPGQGLERRPVLLLLLRPARRDHRLRLPPGLGHDVRGRQPELAGGSGQTAPGTYRRAHLQPAAPAAGGGRPAGLPGPAPARRGAPPRGGGGPAPAPLSPLPPPAPPPLPHGPAAFRRRDRSASADPAAQNPPTAGTGPGQPAVQPAGGHPLGCHGPAFP